MMPTFKFRNFSTRVSPHRGVVLRPTPRLFTAVLLGLASLWIQITPAVADPPSVGENGELLLGNPIGSAGDPETLAQQNLMIAIDTPYQVFSESGTLVHVAAWAPDGVPAYGGRVYLNNHPIGRLDENGSLAFRWGVPGNDIADYWVNGSVVRVRWGPEDYAGHVSDEAPSSVLGGEVWFSAMSRTTSFASDHLFVYTDRGLYAPGQTTHIRSIGWHLEGDYEPLVDAEIEYTIIDQDGDVIAGCEVETDAYGVGTADIELPVDLDEGQYLLSAAYQGSHASADLRIEHFTPPVIEIEHTLGRYLMADAERLFFEVSLSYFAGGEFGDAEIRVDAGLDVETPVVSSTYRVSGPGPHQLRLSIADLEALRSVAWEGAEIEVQLTATDSSGRSDDLIRLLEYTVNPYIAVLERDRDYYTAGDPIEIIARITDRDRVPLRDTAIRLTTSRGENLSAITDEGGTAQFSLIMSPEVLFADLYVADVAEPVAHTEIYPQEPQPMRSHIDDAIVTENSEVRVNISFPAGFVPVEDVVHLDVVDTSGALVNAVLIPVIRDGAEHRASGTFVAPSWGSMLLTLFCVGTSESNLSEAPGSGTTLIGLMTEGQNLVVHPGRELQIHLDGIPDQLAPGADYSGRVTVTDANGNPVDAVLGVSTVDRALISLHDPLEITPMDIFYNPELRVIASTGSAILTWPVVSRNWGMSTHDIALPPFPFQQGGAIGTNGYFGEMAGEYLYIVGDQASSDHGSDGLGLSGMGMGGGSSEPSLVVLENAMIDISDAPGYHQFSYRSRDSMSDAAAPVAEIRIRTELPETSLWAPLLYAQSGVGTVEGTMPDAITQQQINIVASDANGGVGVLRRTVRVHQSLSVSIDLPDTVTVGDRVVVPVTVRNDTDSTQSVRVSLVDSQAAVEPLGEVEALVAAGAQHTVRFSLRATVAGEHQVVATATSGDFSDGEQRDLWTRPRGLADVWSASDLVSNDHPFHTELEVPTGGQRTLVTLQISFPAVGTLFAGLDDIVSSLTGNTDAAIEALGGDIIAVSLLYQYRAQRGDDEASLSLLRGQLQAAIGSLVAAQRGDGGWGFWWDEHSNVYLTGYSLEALIAANGIGLSGVELPMTRAAESLLASYSGGMYDQSAIAFWEGNTQRVRTALTAEIFNMLTRLPESSRPDDWADVLQAMDRSLAAHVTGATLDIMTVAHAVSGMHRMSGAIETTLSTTELQTAANRLFDLRNDGHWEPSWFNSYGGTIEATVAVLEMMVEFEDLRSDHRLRQVVRYLTSTRPEWGAWHNPRGTAAAMRGLLLLNPSGPEIASGVRISVDGETVHLTNIDPEDPYLSALELSAFDLTPYLTSGSREIEVTYNGQLEPQVRLTLSHWPDEPSAVAAAAGSQLHIQSLISGAAVEVEGTLELALTIRSERPSADLVLVRIPGSAITELTADSLTALRAAEWVKEAWIEDGAAFALLEISGGETIELSVPIRAAREGRANLPAATVEFWRPLGLSAPVTGAEHPVVVTGL